MISMVEKIKRHNLTNCDEPLAFMISELAQNLMNFLIPHTHRILRKNG